MNEIRINNFPFLSQIQKNDYENERKNIIEKVRSYHENRDAYEEICQQYPKHRLSFDKLDKCKQLAYKNAKTRRTATENISKNVNNNEQINIF